MPFPASPIGHRRLPVMLLVTGLAFLVLDGVGFGPIRSARQTVLSLGRPLGSVVGAVTAPVADLWRGAVHVDRLEDENRDLRRQVAELEGRLAAAPDREAELREVLSATELSYPLDVRSVTARVVTDRITAAGREMEIDKGAEDGVEAGMPAVTGTGLVGRVELVGDRRSVVRPITDSDVSVGVRTRFGLGVVEGDGRGGLVLTPTAELAEAAGPDLDGLRLVTSGLDRSQYPPGIPVARFGPIRVGPNTVDPAGIGRAVSGREQADTDVDGTLPVEPLADITDPRFLTVILAPSS